MLLQRPKHCCQSSNTQLRPNHGQNVKKRVAVAAQFPVNCKIGHSHAEKLCTRLQGAGSESKLSQLAQLQDRARNGMTCACKYVHAFLQRLTLLLEGKHTDLTLICCLKVACCLEIGCRACANASVRTHEPLLFCTMNNS